MKILAIDPANKLTSFVVVEDNVIIEKGKIPNEDFITMLESIEVDLVALEIIVNMGLSCAQLIETTEMVGIYTYIVNSLGIPLKRVKRTDVKKHFKVKRKYKENGQWVKVPSADSQIRTSLIEKYGEVGRKNNQGYFYGMKEDMWQAFAVYDYVLCNK